MFQRESVQKLHGDEGCFAVLVVDFVDRADVGMIQGGRRLRLPFEAGESLRIFGNLVRQKLQGDEAVQLYVLCLVDNTHAATAEFLDDAVMRDSLADHSWRI